MKIIARILIILAVFSAVAGLMVLAVNANGTSAVPAGFDGAPSQLRPGDDDDGNWTRPEGGEFKPGNAQFRPERGDREGIGGGSRWMFGMVKNVVVIAVVVILIALPRNIVKKKKRQAAAGSVSEQV